MKRIVYLICLLSAVQANATLTTITNDASFATWRDTNINPAILQVNTNTIDISASTILISANTVTGALNTAGIALNVSDITATSNAFITADGVVSVAYAAADTVVSNGVTAGYIAADTALSNALAGAGSGISAATATNIALEVVATSDVTNLISGGATSTYVPTANGSGGITWAAQVGGGISATTATNIAEYVVSASNSLYATAAQGSTADTAMQPSDGTAISNAFIAADTVVTDAYIAADTVVSNALASAGGSVLPISPYLLEVAYTFDGSLTNDCWGNSTGTTTNSRSAFSSVGGGYMRLDGGSTVMNTQTPTITASTNHSFFVRFNTNVSNGFPLVINNSSPTYYVYRYLASIEFYYNDTSSTNIPAASGVWHTVIGVMDSGGVELYLNGSLVHSDATVLTFTETVSMGKKIATGSQGSISVSSFYFWKRSLSADEISRLHALESLGIYGVQGLNSGL